MLYYVYVLEIIYQYYILQEEEIKMVIQLIGLVMLIKKVYKFEKVRKIIDVERKFSVFIVFR